MKGEIIDIGVFVDTFGNKEYRVTINFNEVPKIHLGSCEVKQIK